MTARWSPPPQPGPPLILTRRETQVLARLHRGMSNKQIGVELYITEQTVKSHLKRLFKRAGARDRAHLVAITCARQVWVKGRRAVGGVKSTSPDWPWRGGRGRAGVTGFYCWRCWHSHITRKTCPRCLCLRRRYQPPTPEQADREAPVVLERVVFSEPAA